MTTTSLGSVVEHPIGTGGRFAARLHVGGIAIRAVDGEVARVRSVSGRDLGERFRVRTAAGELEIEHVGGRSIGFVLAIGPRRRGEDDLEVELPRGAAVSVETASGDVAVEGIHGPGRYRTASGDLELRGVRGVLDISAVSGDVRIDADAEVGLQLRTVSGDARVRAPRIGRLAANSVSGSLRIDGDLAGAGPFAVETLSGDAVVVAHRGLRVDARTITGEIRSDVDHRVQEGGGRRALVVGDGAAVLAFKSVSGGLRIAAPRAAARPGPADATAERADGDADDATAGGAATSGDEEDDGRLEVLRALERGELTVAEATNRLATIDEEDAR